MKLNGVSDSDGVRRVYLFWCPGCEEPHPYRFASTPADPSAPVWGFNGDLERPTFTPSLLVRGCAPKGRCHLFMVDGMLQFCSDSEHGLAGKTVPVPDWDDDKW